MGNRKKWQWAGGHATGNLMQIGYEGGTLIKDKMTPDPPAMPDAVAPVEEIDVSAQKEYTKKKAKERKGRQSTILGSNNKGKKTVLG